MSNQTRRRGPMGHGHMGGEKAKDFKGAMKQLIAYMMRYKFPYFVYVYFLPLAVRFLQLSGRRFLVMRLQKFLQD